MAKVRINSFEYDTTILQPTDYINSRIVTAWFYWAICFFHLLLFFLTVYFWKRPCGFVDKRRLSRTCFIIAAIFALLQMIGWSCIIYLAATGALS